MAADVVITKTRTRQILVSNRSSRDHAIVIVEGLSLAPVH
jgi:hypothetical protein